jgi:hypothetical protein
MKYLYTLILTAIFLYTNNSYSQSTTNASVTGIVVDDFGEPIMGAHIKAVHESSGTEYGAMTRMDGDFDIPAMRVGGPYKITVSYIGFETQELGNVYLALGERFRLNITMQEGVELKAIELSSRRSSLINPNRTGAATNINKEAIESMPTISRSVTDFTRLTPQSSGTSFAGQDPKSINFTLDGTVMTNTFGLSGSVPGASTNSNPVSLDAIEEIQVNIAPYDVTQGGFTGAGINAITRSGDNEFRASAFMNARNERLVGTNAMNSQVITEDFSVRQYGFRVGGPIIKDKLFIFVSGEIEERTDPGTSFVANEPGVSGDNVTRVLRSDLENVRQTLINRFGYNPGGWQGYTLPTNSIKLLTKIDYNISDVHKLSARFNMLESEQGRLTATSSLGFGGRHSNLFSMNFQNTNYLLNENFYSGIIELNSTFSNKVSNSMTLGYTAQTNFRSWNGGDFPAIDILQDGRNYISAGTDVLSPNRGLDSDIWQFQNNTKIFLKKHTLTAGVNFEAFNFNYTFTPAYFGQYVYNSLDDFYAHMDGQQVELLRFQKSYSGLADGGIPVANTKAYIASAYIQDEIDLGLNFKLTAGVRLDVPFYGNTAIRNPEVEGLNFFRPNGEPITIQTDRLPDPQFMINPRLGFNWDVGGKGEFQIRGGTGFFTGRPIYVNISNMINSNGLSLGQIQENNTTNFPFDPNINAHNPANPGAPETYDLAYIEPEFKNPQVWRSNIGIDKVLFNGIVGTFEAIYTKQLSDLIFYDANLRAPNTNLSGPDNRPIYGFSDDNNRINPNVTNAVVMGNTNEGYSYSLTGQVSREFSNNFSAMIAYNYSVARNMVDGNTQHYLSYENIHSVNGGNYPTLGYSLDDQRHRFITSVNYGIDYKLFGKEMSSKFSLFYELANQGAFSYVYNGDANGDQIIGNDLIFVPTQQQLQQMQFAPLTLNNGVLLDPEQQRIMFNNFIEQDSYLKGRRGDYAERNGAQLPTVGRLDLSFTQDFHFKMADKKNTLQFRADIINFTNMLNKNWGVGTTFVNNAPVGIVNIDENNVPTYQLNPVGNAVPTESYTRTANILDVWQLQFGFRYIFN